MAKVLTLMAELCLNPEISNLIRNGCVRGSQFKEVCMRSVSTMITCLASSEAGSLYSCATFCFFSLCCVYLPRPSTCPVYFIPPPLIDDTCVWFLKFRMNFLIHSNPPDIWFKILLGAT